MSGAGDQSPVTGPPRSSWVSRRAAADLGGSEVAGFPGSVLQRMVAAGMVVAVAVCLSWMPVRGFALGAAGPDRHAAGARARLLAGPGESGARCSSGVAVPAGPGVHGALAVPDRFCRRYRRLLSSGRPPGHRGHDIRVLAFRHRIAEEPAWSKRRGCAAMARMPRLAAAVTDPAWGKAGAEVPADPGSRAAPGRLRGTSPGPATLTCIPVGAGGLRPGAGIAGRWCGAFSGGQVGCGDRATLPGRSPRYHVIWLVCDQCGTELALLFYDQGDLPLCASCPGGQLGLRS